MSLVETMSKRQMEDEINNALIAFQEEYMGCVPADARSYIVQDILMIRFFGVLSPSELNLAQDHKGCSLIKDTRSRLLEDLQSVLFKIVKEITGCSPASLHGDVSTRTGEMLLAITLSEDLERKLTVER